jgi:hypothetical protein
MHIYLSYIERNGHAALMLSEQISESEPPKVVCELGFALSLDVAEVGYLGTYKGRVGEETNAARALYSSSSDVRHRTFEISQAEMLKFYQILNRDRAINQDKIGPTDRAVKYEGGPDYQKLRHNCKGYALGIFKELGVIEADGLSNFFIQRPHTHTELLQPLSGEVMSCPMKEKLEEKTTSLLERINNEIQSINLEDEEISKETISAVEKLNEQTDMLVKNIKKLGINAALNQHFEQIDTLLDTVSAKVEIKAIASLKEELAEAKQMAIEVSELSKEGILPIHWKPDFPVAKRLVLNNFDAEEKALYSVKIKTNEMSDGLEQLLSDIAEKMDSAKSFKRDLYCDLVDLTAMIKEAKDAVDNSKQTFLQTIENPNSKDLKEACAQQHKTIDDITERLEQRLNDFQPKSEETSAFMRLINKIISYVKNDFIVVESMQSLMKDSLKSLRASSEMLPKEEEHSSQVSLGQ